MPSTVSPILSINKEEAGLKKNGNEMNKKLKIDPSIFFILSLFNLPFRELNTRSSYYKEKQQPLHCRPMPRSVHFSKAGEGIFSRVFLLSLWTGFP